MDEQGARNLKLGLELNESQLSRFNQAVRGMISQVHELVGELQKAERLMGSVMGRQGGGFVSATNMSGMSTAQMSTKVGGIGGGVGGGVGSYANNISRAVADSGQLLAAAGKNATSALQGMGDSTSKELRNIKELRQEVERLNNEWNDLESKKKRGIIGAGTLDRGRAALSPAYSQANMALQAAERNYGMGGAPTTTELMEEVVGAGGGRRRGFASRALQSMGFLAPAGAVGVGVGGTGGGGMGTAIAAGLGMVTGLPGLAGMGGALTTAAMVAAPFAVSAGLTSLYSRTRLAEVDYSRFTQMEGPYERGARIGGSIGAMGARMKYGRDLSTAYAVSQVMKDQQAANYFTGLPSLIGEQIKHSTGFDLGTGRFIAGVPGAISSWKGILGGIATPGNGIAPEHLSAFKQDFLKDATVSEQVVKLAAQRAASDVDVTATLSSLGENAYSRMGVMRAGRIGSWGKTTYERVVGDDGVSGMQHVRHTGLEAFERQMGKMGRTAAEGAAARAALGAVGPWGYMGAGVMTLGMQEAGLSNVNSIFSAMSQLDPSKKRWKGGLPSGLYALAHGIGSGGLDVGAGRVVGDVASSLMQGGNFVGGQEGGFSRGQQGNLMQRLMAISYTGTPGGDLQRAQMLAPGLQAYNQQVTGKTDRLQEAINISAFTRAMPGVAPGVRNLMANIGSAAELGIISSKEKKLPEWMARAMGVSQEKGYSMYMAAYSARQGADLVGLGPGQIGTGTPFAQTIEGMRRAGGPKAYFEEITRGVRGTKKESRAHKIRALANKVEEDLATAYQERTPGLERRAAIGQASLAIAGARDEKGDLLITSPRTKGIGDIVAKDDPSKIFAGEAGKAAAAMEQAYVKHLTKITEGAGLMGVLGDKFLKVSSDMVFGGQNVCTLFDELSKTLVEFITRTDPSRAAEMTKFQESYRIALNKLHDEKVKNQQNEAPPSAKPPSDKRDTGRGGSQSVWNK